MNKTYYANSLCGGIKIKIKGKLRNVNNCHCSQCMKTHGNFASYTSCEEQDLDFLSKKIFYKLLSMFKFIYFNNNFILFILATICHVILLPIYLLKLVYEEI